VGSIQHPTGGYVAKGASVGGHKKMDTVDVSDVFDELRAFLVTTKCTRFFLSFYTENEINGHGYRAVISHNELGFVSTAVKFGGNGSTYIIHQKR